MADAARTNSGTNSGVNSGGFLSRIIPQGSASNLYIGICVLVVPLMIIVPLPGWMIDILMMLNLIFSLLVLLIVLYSQNPTEFSLFPTVLLVATVFGLALNVSSTRLILTTERTTEFSGQMIKVFSSFVVGSGERAGLVVGFIIFIIIIAVQVVVITKGATRISEVAARFNLDGMPVKYMAVDAEFSAGSITEEEAQRRKAQIEQESKFYGSMDGASKFISGNVKIGIFITAVNVIGGIIICAVRGEERLALAAENYIRFCVGDGLLSQIPALLISVAMGIVVTRASATGNLSEQVAEQFTTSARIFWIAAAVLAGFVLLPFPFVTRMTLVVLSGILALGAFQIGRKKKKEASYKEMMAQTKDAKKGKEKTHEMSPVVPLDVLSLELGYGLIPLVDKEKGAELLERVRGVRRQSALELGLVFPDLRIIDNMMMEPSEYCFKIKGINVGKGRIRMGGYFLCIKSAAVTEDIPGEKTVDPAFGLPAIWVSEDRRDEAERAGYTVVDPPSIIATHLTEIIKRNAADILGLQETQAMLDTLRKDHPAVVDEVLKPRPDRPDLAISAVKIQKILHGLLKERVSIRNMVTILEAIAEYAPVSSSVWFLTEKVRQALGSQICHQYADDDHRLRVLTIAPELEQKIFESKYETHSGVVCALDPATQQAWIKAVGKAASAVTKNGYLPVILCSEKVRYLVKNSTDRELPNLAVLSVPEITKDIIPEAIGVIRIDGGE